MTWISLLTEFGQQSLVYLWIPVGLWTLAAIPIYALSRHLGQRHPLIHYQGLLALMLALPVGLLLIPFVNEITPEAQIPVVSDWIDTASTPVMVPQAESTYDVVVNEATAEDFSIYTVPPDDAKPVPSPVEEEAASIPANEAAFNWFAWLGLVTLLLLGICLFTLLKLGVNLIRLFTMRSYLTPASEHVALLQELAESFEIRRPIFLAYGPIGIPPMTFGWLYPVIAIPDSLKDDPTALRTTLLHELIHIRRNDFFWGLISRFVAAAFVFHPGIWWISRELNLYRELSCDTDTLASQSQSPADYARLLLQFNSVLSRHNSPSVAISMVHKQSSLKRRIKHMTRSIIQYPVAIRFLVILTFLLLPAVLVACSSNQGNVEPQEVSTLDDKKNALIKLEAEVQYLRSETMTVKARLDTLRYERNRTDDELQRAVIQREFEYQQYRTRILDTMLWRKVEELERTKVDLISDQMLTNVN